MTTDIERQFFETFGIEPKLEEYDVIVCTKSDTKPIRESRWHKFYPQITDRILLGLICMANQHEDYPISTNIKNIQARTLRILLRTEKLYKKYHGSDGRYKKLVKQVQALFKEG